MKLIDFLVLLALAEVELGTIEGLALGRLGKDGLHVGLRQGRELAEELGPPLDEHWGSFLAGIREIEEGGRGAEFLALK